MTSRELAGSEPALGSAVAIGFGPGHHATLLELLREVQLLTDVKGVEAALAAARRTRPSVILVADVEGVDAREVVAAVRRDPDLHTVPVVTLTVDLGPSERVDLVAHPRKREGRDRHQVAQALQRLMLDQVMKVSYILASAAHSGDDTIDRQVLVAIARLDEIAIELRDAVIDLERGSG